MLRKQPAGARTFALPRSKETQLHVVVDGDEQLRMQRKQVVRTRAAAGMPQGVVTQQYTACCFS